MARYPSGQPVRISTTVRDVTGTLVDAGALTLTVQKPDASTQAYSSPTHDSTGTYHQDIPAADLAQNGHYLYVWQSTGTGAGVSRGDFDVFDPFEPAIMSLQDAKDTLNIKQTTTADDNEIQGMIDSIETDLEAITGGPLVNRTITERVEVTQSYTALCLRKRPVVSVTSVTDVSFGLVLSIADLDVDTNAGIVRRKLLLPFFSRGPYYTVVYVAGWGTVMPAAFNQAARIIIKHMWETQRGPQQRRYGNAEPEEIMLPGMSYAIPNRALEKLRPFTLEAYV
jgi:hypothetical protein